MRGKQMGVRAESGQAKAIASGELTSFFGNPIALTLTDWRFVVHFEFAHDDGEVRLDVQSDDSHMRIVVYNFLDGRGTAQPIPLVRRDGHGLWLHFRVFRFGNTDEHTLHYTFWATPLEDDAESAG